MTAQLVGQIRQYLSGVEATQEELSELYHRKRSALAKARAKDLMQIVRAETELTGRLRSYQTQRQRILQQSAQAGIRADSIQGLVGTMDAAAREELEPRIHQARVTSARVRRESWIHWIIAQRAMNHYNELLDFIAHHGRKSPTYANQAGPESGKGGAILDASA